jgi:hypothetical protein
VNILNLVISTVEGHCVTPSSIRCVDRERAVLRGDDHVQSVWTTSRMCELKSA